MNGKVDVKALPAPERLRPELSAGYAAPKGELERAIAAVWQELLGLEKVGASWPPGTMVLGPHSAACLALSVIIRLRQ